MIQTIKKIRGKVRTQSRLVMTIALATFILASCASLEEITPTDTFIAPTPSPTVNLEQCDNYFAENGTKLADYDFSTQEQRDIFVNCVGDAAIDLLGFDQYQDRIAFRVAFGQFDENIVVEANTSFYDPTRSTTSSINSSNLLSYHRSQTSFKQTENLTCSIAWTADAFEHYANAENSSTLADAISTGVHELTGHCRPGIDPDATSARDELSRMPTETEDNVEFYQRDFFGAYNEVVGYHNQLALDLSDNSQGHITLTESNFLTNFQIIATSVIGDLSLIEDVMVNYWSPFMNENVYDNAAGSGLVYSNPTYGTRFIIPETIVGELAELYGVESKGMEPAFP